MTLHYWQYFVALEADLAATTRFVEPEIDNMECYSIEFARILLSAGSEIDVLCKVLCKKYSLPFSPKNIDGYRNAITAKFNGFTNLKIQVPRYGHNLYPWKDWDNNENPVWWKAYNKVKHERDYNFKKANLENTLNAISGLFVLVCYINKKELKNRTAKPWPQMLTLDPSLSSYISLNRMPGHILPDFAT